jgi:putative aminopeptidase
MHNARARQRGLSPRAAMAVVGLLLAAGRPEGVRAQGVDALAIRFTQMTAVTGLEQAMTDSLLLLLPGSARDRAGDVVVALGRGSPRRLVACPLDEVGYVVGTVTPEGYLLLRRVGGGPRVAYPLFDQLLEGHRVTVFGTRGAVPGVVAVKSVHLTRGRGGPGGADPVFTVDNAFVDLGASSAAEVRALGIEVLAPVALTKLPHVYGSRLLVGPVAGRRAACAALAAAVQAQPKVKGSVVVAFAVGTLYAGDGRVGSLRGLLGPFDEVNVVSLRARYPDTAVETVALADAETRSRELVTWMEGR